MTQDFLDGMLVTLLPSMFVVAWLVLASTFRRALMP